MNTPFRGRHDPIDAHRIDDKLWIGSYPRVPETCGYFDVVVLCAVEKQSVNLPGCHIVKAPLDDDKPTQRELQTAVSAARTVHEFRRRGKRVLVTCAQGVNRSSFVAAMAMMLAGDSASQAISKIREFRKPPIGMTPLSNTHFVAVLHRMGQRPQGLGQHRPISAL